MSENLGLINRLTELIQPICEDLGFELVAINYRRESHGQVLRVIIYHKDGITVDDCAKVSREVSYLLDVEDLIEQKYHLEVSSPGLDWPLTTERDFNRYLGEKCTVSWYTTEGTAKEIGVIRSAADGLLILATERGNQEIPLSRIIKARLVIEF